MDKMKRYIDCYIPTETCNLRCHYCYIAQKRKFNNQLASFPRSVKEIASALSRERLGGTCLLNLCAGGETLLSDEVLPLAKALLEEGHYVMIVTNGTVSKHFREITQWPSELRSRLIFKFSFHYLEMVRLGWMDRFFDNVQLMKNSGVSFTLEVTPSDELIPHIEELKKVCRERLGALCHVTIARDDRTSGIDILSELSFEEYKQTWGQFKSELFQFKSEIFYQKRREFCYAGDWTAYLNLETGVLTQCYCGETLCNIYNDPGPIPFRAIGTKCPLPHCYNGHSFLTMGDIPELESPTYAEVRNRVCEDGSEWLTPNMKAFMQSKLSESNKPYSFRRKAGDFTADIWDSFRQSVHRMKVRVLSAGSKRK